MCLQIGGPYLRNMAKLDHRKMYSGKQSDFSGVLAQFDLGLFHVISMGNMIFSTWLNLGVSQNVQTNPLKWAW